MDIVLVSLRVPDLGELERQGAAHPILGRLLSGGSYCTVEGVAATAEGAADILAAARAVAAEVQELFILDDPDPDLASLGDRGALCVIAVDGKAAHRPFVILQGRGLPVFGPIPSCTVRDLQTTWITLAGGTPKEGRHLLQEQPEAWDPQLERQLTQRLRQLYGE